MTTAIGIFERLRTRALVTRESARRLHPPINDLLAKGTDEISLDFSGTLGITPSFVDELLQVIQDNLRDHGIPKLQLMLKNPPTRLSLKFTALAKGRGAQLKDSEASTWVIALGPSPVSAYHR